MAIEAGGGGGPRADAVGRAESHGTGGLAREPDDFGSDGATVTRNEGNAIPDGSVMSEAGNINGKAGEAADMAADIDPGERLEAGGRGLRARREGNLSHMMIFSLIVTRFESGYPSFCHFVSSKSEKYVDLREAWHYKTIVGCKRGNDEGSFG